MFPTDPRQMQQLLRQMGIKSKTLNAKKVIIELEGDTKLVIDKPQVIEMDVRGEKTYSITGNPHEEEVINEEDVELIMNSVEGVSREDAIKALKEKGDVASAILHLKSED